MEQVGRNHRNMKKKLLKMIGHKFDTRYSWGEFCWTLHPKKWGFSIRIYDGWDDENKDMLLFHLFLFKIYIHLPTKICQSGEHGQRGNGKAYGFYVYESLRNFTTFVISWGKWSKHIEMPWSYEWFSTEILDHDYNSVYYEDKYMDRRGSKWRSMWERMEEVKRSVEKTYDYTYSTRGGEVQHRKASVIVERRVWTMRWLPLKKMIRTSIWATFNEGIGEKTWDWKGGTNGCGYEIKKGETPEMTLRRMERERTL